MAPRFRPAALAALALLLAAPLASVAGAQGIRRDTPIRPVTRTLAITDARVVVAPGRVLDRATVVVRDGRIEAVGRDVEVPFDAHVIEADTLTVYAGFVDALGYAGVPKPEDEERPENIDPGAPPRQFAGITPDRDVRETYDASDAAVKGLREAGFTVAHVAPRDGLFSGQGAVVLLRDLGRLEEAPAVVLAGPVSFVARLDPASGVYPATPMGVLAVMRETVENARRRASAREAFDDARDGTARPRFDPVLDAVEPVLDGERLFVFVADGPLDGFRALRASDEMRLRPVLAGVADVSPLLDRLRQSETPVFAPLALPDTVKADSAALALPLPSTTPGGVSFISNRRTFSFRDTGAENTALTGQRRAAVLRAERAPAALDSVGVPFAFATLDVKPADVHKNLRRMVRAGLSPDAALGALTVAPARILGLEREVGTVERGKLANLVVTTGDLFTSDSAAVRLVVVDGVEYEIEVKSGPEGADPDAVVQAVGTWDYEVATPAGTQSGRFTISGSEGAYTGEIAGADGETDPLNSVTVAGNVLTMSFQSDDVGTVTITGTIEDDEFEGTAEIASFGSFPLTATRRPD